MSLNIRWRLVVCGFVLCVLPSLSHYSTSCLMHRQNFRFHVMCFFFFFFAGQFNKTCARLGWNVLMVSSQQRSSCFLSVTVLRSSTFAVWTLLLLLMINTNIFRTSPSRGWEGTISNPALQFYYNQPNFEIQNTIFQCRQVEGDVIDLHLSQFTKPDKKCNASKRLENFYS